ncbi:MAG: GNAT family N-acetyltransferase [Candidatus Aenigmarchaeota archaeon]|nr:GNAT family N-acetyltransferase [Candidatus Aenigmarchaeota archaeon]
MIKIQKVKLDEIPKAKRLLSYTWVDTYGSFFSKEAIRKITRVWHHPKTLAIQAKNPDIFFGVAKTEKGKIVGLVTVRKIKDSKIFMNRLYVHPKYQRKGIGKKLMDKAARHFRARKIRLEVEEKNKKGLNFYLKNGFRKIRKKIEVIEGQKMITIVMEKRIKRDTNKVRW